MKTMFPHTKEKRKRYQSCKSVPTFSEQDSRSPAVPGNIFLAPVEINQKPAKRTGLLCKLHAHPKILIAKHLVYFTATFPNLRPF